MIFISLNKRREKFGKEDIAKVNELAKTLAKDGVKVLANYWTLGRYDAVWIYEAPNEKAMMKAQLRVGDIVATETLVAVPRAEAVKLVE
jgi:uncharacterized protein with GYD domain